MNDPGNAVLPPEKPLIKSSRALSIALRTLHLIGFAVLLGGHWFNVPRAELLPWLYWSVLSGAGLMALELRGGLGWLRQLAGGLTLAKLALLCLIPAFWEQRRVLLLLIAVAGSVGSHLPSALRHFDLLKFRPSGERCA